MGSFVGASGDAEAQHDYHLRSFQQSFVSLRWGLRVDKGLTSFRVSSIWTTKKKLRGSILSACANAIWVAPSLRALATISRVARWTDRPAPPKYTKSVAAITVRRQVWHVPVCARDGRCLLQQTCTGLSVEAVSPSSYNPSTASRSASPA